MPRVDPYGKTEVWITGVRLDGARLPAVAAAAADALELPPADVFVTDVRDDHLVLDILSPNLDLAAIAGRASALLAAIDTVDGVTVTRDADVHSHGVLGVLGAPADQANSIVTAADELDARLRAYIAQRVAVLSTGVEIGDGRVADTNLEAAAEVLGAAGFDVTPAGVVPDDEASIAGRVAFLADDGYGLIVTTGGVGAEDKDHTIEAIQRVSHDFATAILATYAVGHGRHVKAHVRVGAGNIGSATIVALPGPTREARAGLAALVTGLAHDDPPAVLAERIAAAIRALWPGGATNHHPRH